MQQAAAAAAHYHQQMMMQPKYADISPQYSETSTPPTIDTVNHVWVSRRQPTTLSQSTRTREWVMSRCRRLILFILLMLFMCLAIGALLWYIISLLQGEPMAPSVKDLYMHEWMVWSPWSQCDRTCGDGTKFRFRNCRLQSNQKPADGPLPCVGRTTELRNCSSSCSDSQKWTPWSSWGPCSSRYKAGYTVSSRRCVSATKCTGNWTKTKKCVGALKHLPPTKPWLPWKSCSRSCGGGTQHRYTKSQDNIDTRTCNLHRCMVKFFGVHQRHLNSYEDKKWKAIKYEYIIRHDFETPESGYYFLTMYGAGGGNFIKGGAVLSNGGRGAMVRVRVYLYKKTKLVIVLGVKGQDGTDGRGGAGGGATLAYYTRKDDGISHTVLLGCAAGGGGSAVSEVDQSLICCPGLHGRVVDEGGWSAMSSQLPGVSGRGGVAVQGKDFAGPGGGWWSTAQLVESSTALLAPTPVDYKKVSREFPTKVRIDYTAKIQTVAYYASGGNGGGDGGGGGGGGYSGGAGGGKVDGKKGKTGASGGGGGGSFCHGGCHCSSIGGSNYDYGLVIIETPSSQKE